MIQKPWLQTFAYLVWQNKKHFSQNFQIAKRKKGWDVQVEDTHVDLFTIQKKHTFLILQADSYFFT